jgi:hypothetical protein
MLWRLEWLIAFLTSIRLNSLQTFVKLTALRTSLATGLPLCGIR